MCPIGFSNVSPGRRGRNSSSSPSVKEMALKIASGLGVIVLEKRASTARGTKGVGVIVGVSLTEGVGDIVGESVIVGVRLIVGVIVIVGVRVIVTVGGK